MAKLLKVYGHYAGYYVYLTTNKNNPSICRVILKRVQDEACLSHLIFFKNFKPFLNIHGIQREFLNYSNYYCYDPH